MVKQRLDLGGTGAEGGAALGDCGRGCDGVRGGSGRACGSEDVVLSDFVEVGGEERGGGAGKAEAIKLTKALAKLG